MRANTSVAAYRQTRSIAPVRARMRFAFFIIAPFSCTAAFLQISIPKITVYGNHILLYNKLAIETTFLDKGAVYNE